MGLLLLHVIYLYNTCKLHSLVKNQKHECLADNELAHSLVIGRIKEDTTNTNLFIGKKKGTFNILGQSEN